MNQPASTISLPFTRTALAILLLTAACSLTAELPPVPVPPENPMTEDKRVLGKILFWDEQLSSDDSVACGSCHMPSAGGADARQAISPGHDGVFDTDDDVIGSPGIVRLDETGQAVEDPSFGFDPQVTGRAAPGIFISMYSDSNFWDGRAESQFTDPQDGQTVVIESGGSLESQAIAPILSSVEMGHQGRTWNQVIDKLAGSPPLRFATDVPPDIAVVIEQDPSYPELFSLAFGDEEITAARIAMAIATYERTLIPDQSPWDLYQAGDETAMTLGQIAGWEDFRDNTVCDNCHVPPEFTDHLFYNIGLRPSVEDLGRELVTAQAGDTGRFKTPTLRNSGLKQSLMHVGWIDSVRDGIDFYNAVADESNGIFNRHVQFPEDQTRIPDMNGNPIRDYDDLSMFSVSDARKNQVADFIANALTDPRVAAEQFPFDRPTLRSERSMSIVVSGAMSGTWSDPAQKGEIWMIEVLSGERALVTWYSYNFDGAQMWLVGVGQINGSVIHIDDLQIGSGRVFGPDFDPDDLAFSSWGSVDIEFNDCNSALISYLGTGVFGGGTLNATRLTQLAGLECVP